MTGSGRPQVGLVDAILGEIDVLRPQKGRTRPSSWQGDRGFSFSPRTSQLWRFVLGSNAAALTEIGKGGTDNASELAGPIDDLFARSAAIFGNAVVLGPHAKGLTEEERVRLCSGDSLRGGLASSAEVDERHVQKQLGLASAEMTLRYQSRRDRFRINLANAAGL
jgi:hypothetical protein